jgi:hypothetical protein
MPLNFREMTVVLKQLQAEASGNRDRDGVCVRSSEAAAASDLG